MMPTETLIRRAMSYQPGRPLEDWRRIVTQAPGANVTDFDDAMRQLVCDGIVERSWDGCHDIYSLVPPECRR